MSEDQRFFNPVLETYKGKQIRKYNVIHLRVGIDEYKKIIDAKENLGLSEKAAIQRGIAICPPCNENKLSSK